MALSLKLGKLDAICAKLKSHTPEGPSSNDNDEASLSEPPEASESNNNNQKTLDFNGSVPPEPVAPSTPIIQPAPLLASTPDTAKTYQAATPKSSKSSGRKKSRKSACPRNLAQYEDVKFSEGTRKDELGPYEINNQNTHFPPQEGETDELLAQDLSMDSSRATSPDDLDPHSQIDSMASDKEDSICAEKSELNSSSYASSGFPLDLSVSRAADDASVNGSPRSADSDREATYQSTLESHDHAADLSTDHVTPDTHDSPAKPMVSAEARVLQDYAKNTMNELLSIYGFGGSADSVTKQIPLKNFTLYQHQSPSAQDLMEGSSSDIQPLPKTAHMDGKSQSSNKGIFNNQFQKLAQINGGHPHSTPSPTSNPATTFKPIAPSIKLSPPLTQSSSSATQHHAGLKSSPSSSKSNVGGEFSKFRLNPAGHKLSHASSSGKTFNPDYTKYLKRFHNGEDCGGTHCKDLGYREHYHCMDCSFKVFVKKEEMVRHFKWHKKRDDSLQHGFLRFSPMDDCSQKFGTCTHNGRQTHYHCLQPGCDKVYISTSDVQMHANYHRKDSAIIMEGFQRFRATEDCGTPSCQFYGQRTTHFHCRRTSCKFTFKNKADMEKHKSYHQKDEILGRDGFKKFMKYEHCSYKACRFSKISNHIHCIRPGCNYVLHSTAQLYSHKRKHERRDFENAYRNFRQVQKSTTPQPRPAQQVMSSLQGVSALSGAGQILAQVPMTMGTSLAHQVVPSMSLPVKIKTEMESPKGKKSDSGNSNSMSPPIMERKVKVKLEPKEVKDTMRLDHSSGLLNHAAIVSEEKLNDSLTLPIPSAISPQKDSSNPPSSGENTPSHGIELIRPSPEKREKDESWKAYLIRYTANDPCNSRCQYLYKDHYHCRVDGCQVLFRSKDGVREHAKFHEIQDRITPLVYLMYEELQACPQSCQLNLKQKHYHCNWTGCSHAIPHTGPAFARLEHYRIHEYAKASGGKGKFGNSKDDEFSKRRRGRPPKYPRTEIPTVPKVELPESVIQESVRLYSEGKFDPTAEVINGFKHFTSDEPCPDTQCMYYMKDHFHCARPRCHHATDRMDVLNLHAKDFHNFVNILEGFEFFDRNIDCRRPHCHNNRANRHFHCLKPKCDYSFVRHSTMVQHDRKHKMPPVPKIAPVPASAKKEVSNFIPIVPAVPGLQLDPKNKNVVKAAGTFYPMSPLTDVRGTAPGTVFSQHLSLSMASNLTMANTLSTQAMMAQPLPSTISALPTNMSTLFMAGGQLQLPMASAMPLTVLLQQKGLTPPQPNWGQMRSKMHYALNSNCGRPFCKLKKKDHYHCLECNQAFSDPARLRCHMGKHGLRFRRSESGGRAGKHVHLMPKPAPMAGLDLSNTAQLVEEEVDEEEEEEEEIAEEDEQQEGSFELSASSSLNLNPEAFANMLQRRQTLGSDNSSEEIEDEEEEDINGNSMDETLVEEATNGSDSYNYSYDSYDDGPLVVDEGQGSDAGNEDAEEPEVGLNLSISRRSGRKRIATRHEDFIDSDMLMAKQRRLSSPQSSKDQVVIPEGFTKHRSGDDCGYTTCTYRQSSTHYHCMREDCGYGFSDRTRFIQHVLRHERLDNIMGGEFYHFRSSVACGSSDCELSIKSSHFHCLKCPFACADSSKVQAHRKYHSKMDSIASNGFQKFTGNEDCRNTMCSYYKKQTHYHCTFPSCHYAVLGPAQMAAHKAKHPQEELN
ncbi:zinc finger protein castor homolog 1-like [Haliotis cracherodii]|uniref:zinc finger protein castor homolog 1-like n=1 Tax=Haliotis cracherodii TaxID=6455 RepID=UPI0039EC659B